MTSQILTKTGNSRVRKPVSGFTLIELLLVLVLMAISMAAITPRLGGSISGWQVGEGAMNILAAIRLARQTAVGGQRITVFTVDANNSSFTVEYIKESADSGNPTKEFIVRQHSLGKSIKIAPLKGFERIDNRHGLVFQPDGRTKTAHIKLTTNKTNITDEWHILIESDGTAVLRETFENE